MSPQSDPVWVRLRHEVDEMARTEPLLAAYLHDAVLKHRSLERALSFFLAGKLASSYLSAVSLVDIINEALSASGDIRKAVRRDLSAVLERDPAARSMAQPFLYFKGFHALQSYRVAHWLWSQKRQPLALYLQNRISEAFDVDIHPAARIGKGILLDHGTSVVIGETAVVGDDVSMLHEVTLGGTGKEKGKTGQVLQVLRDEARVLVQGVNMVKRHTRPAPGNPGGIIEKEAPLHISNVAHVDPKENKPTRVGYKTVDGRKVRFARRSGEMIDR